MYTNSENKVLITKLVPNPDYKWWNLEPKFIREEYPAKFKLNEEGYLIIE